MYDFQASVGAAAATFGRTKWAILGLAASTHLGAAVAHILALSAEAVNLGAAPRDNNHRRKLHGVAVIEAVAFVSVCFGFCLLEQALVD
jgi:hypothetical protein